MPYVDTFDQIDFNMTRDSAFSYTCNACARCCHHKGIRVSPYEILRLARHLGITTTEFIAQHTEAGGTMLRGSDDNDGACIFLTTKGCGVHPARPLVCRIYPLGRWIDPEGRESFGHMAPHPQTAGLYGTGATVADYLTQQGLAPYCEVSDRYSEVYKRMIAALERLDPEELEQRANRRQDIDEGEAGIAASDWIDIDRTVADYCRAQNRPVPSDIDGLISLHIEAVEFWIASL